MDKAMLEGALEYAKWNRLNIKNRTVWDDHMVALAEGYEALADEISREVKEHDMATTFHALAVKERDYERARTERAEAQLEEGRRLARESYDAAVEFLERAERAEARAERYKKALMVYADEKFYFPRGIILLAQREGVRLASVYSDFGDTAREALKEDAS